MRLKECYIENFGKLSAFRYSFSDGLNVIVGENGYGKTTLTVFIKAMLYGIDASKKQKGEMTDRKRYLPWNKGRCGGSLTFSANEKTYRIERTFGDKASLDEFAIYEAVSGRISTDFSENVGEELFGIDADGFERTVFLSEKKLSVTASNQTVTAKLSNLSNADGDMGDIDKVLAELDKRERYYMHKRGKGGIVWELRDKIAEIDTQLLMLERKKDEYYEDEKKLNLITQNIKEYERKREFFESKRRVSEYEKQYLAMTNALLPYKKQLEEEEDFFKNGYPTNEDLRYYEGRLAEIEVLKFSISRTESELKAPFDDKSAAIRSHLDALGSNSPKKPRRAYPIMLVLSAVSLIFGLFLGLFINQILYTVSALAIIFALFAVSNRKRLKVFDSFKSKTEAAADFIFKEKGILLSDEDKVRDALVEMERTAATELAERKRKEKELDANVQKLNDLSEECALFLSGYKTVTNDPFGEIRSHLASYASLKKHVESQEKTAEEFKNAHGISISSSEDVNSYADADAMIFEIDEKLKSLRAEYYALDSKLQAIQTQLSSSDVLNEQRLELSDSLADAQFMHKITVRAASEFISARERLTEKYLGKTRKAFDGYVSEISGESGSDFSMNTDFSIKKSEGGLTNPAESYSLGTQECYSLITRLALAEALYENEEPFIILDDPFAHFDDKKCAAALKLLERLCNRVQIIYLTCSEHRAPAK